MWNMWKEMGSHLTVWNLFKNYKWCTMFDWLLIVHLIVLIGYFLLLVHFISLTGYSASMFVCLLLVHVIWLTGNSTSPQQGELHTQQGPLRKASCCMSASYIPRTGFHRDPLKHTPIVKQLGYIEPGFVFQFKSCQSFEWHHSIGCCWY